MTQPGAIHQATCIAIAGRAVLIEGGPGMGKTSLALALIDRGATLVGDDGVTLCAAGDRLLAAPPPHTAGLIEVRNLGLVPMAAEGPFPVSLVLMLDEQAPRFIEAAERCERGGVALPLVRLWPGGPILHLKAEIALATYGL